MDFKNAPFYILCLFHMINLRKFSLSFLILLQNGPWFDMLSICSCCSFWRNIDVSVFQQLSSDKCEFDSIWKQTLFGGSQISYQIEKHKSFQEKSFYYAPTRSVSFLKSVLNFQTSITDGWRPRMSRYFCLLCNWLRSIYWQQKILIIPDPKEINGQLLQKSMTSCRRNERCQRHKTSWFDFVIAFAFKNKHRFENFFRSLLKVWVLCDFLNLSCLRIIATSPQSYATAFRFSYWMQAKGRNLSILFFT